MNFQHMKTGAIETVDLKGLLQWDGAVMKELSFPDTQKDVKAVAVISAPLNADQAKLIKCGHLFKTNGDPVDEIGKYSPPIKLIDIDLQLPSGTNEGMNTYRPELVRGFQIVPVDDLHMTVQFRIHITGAERGYELLATRIKFLGKPIACSLRALQGEFNFTEESEGTRVSMSGEEAKAEADGPLFNPPPMETAVLTEQPPAEAELSCVYCDMESPFNADGKHIMDGELVACMAGRGKPEPDFAAPAETAAAEGPALADARDLGEPTRPTVPAPRSSKGQFVKGSSGNPAGVAKGKTAKPKPEQKPTQTRRAAASVTVQ